MVISLKELPIRISLAANKNMDCYEDGACNYYVSVAASCTMPFLSGAVALSPDTKTQETLAWVAVGVETLASVTRLGSKRLRNCGALMTVVTTALNLAVALTHDSGTKRIIAWAATGAGALASCFSTMADEEEKKEQRFRNDYLEDQNSYMQRLLTSTEERRNYAEEKNRKYEDWRTTRKNDKRIGGWLDGEAWGRWWNDYQEET